MQNIEAETPHAFTWDKETHAWTWHEVLLRTLVELGGSASLNALYAIIEPHPKTQGRKHWQARLRQVLQSSSAFVCVGSGVWSLASKYSPEKVDEFNRIRREEHPLLGPRAHKSS